MAARGPYSRGHLILGGIPHILSAWAQWDSGNYLSIAQQGYGHIPGDVAFFPLFPLVLRILGGGTVAGGVVAALILNTVALIGAIILLYQAASRQFGPRAGRWAVAAMLLVPTAFFFGAVYTEATSLLLALAARAAAIRRHFLVASLLAALATASRFPGVLVWILVVAEWWEARRAGEVRPLTWLWLPLGLVGLVGYAVWLQVNFGDALAFNRVETTVFGHVSLLTPGRHPILVLRDILGFAAVAAAVLFLRRWIPWRRADVLFLLCSVGVVILSGGFRSSGRYLLVMYPLNFMNTMQVAYLRSNQGAREGDWGSGLQAPSSKIDGQASGFAGRISRHGDQPLLRPPSATAGGRGHDLRAGGLVDHVPLPLPGPHKRPFVTQAGTRCRRPGRPWRP